MQATRMTLGEREQVLVRLEEMPRHLEAVFAALSPRDALRPGPDDSFSPVEHCWHLADLEREGFAVRIRRLLDETDPVLPDFDGARIAGERNYKTKSLAAGLAAFRAAREANLIALRAVPDDAWRRAGTQEGVGAVALCDIPSMMAGHDESHRQEILAWVRMRRPESSTS